MTTADMIRGFGPEAYVWPLTPLDLIHGAAWSLYNLYGGTTRFATRMLYNLQQAFLCIRRLLMNTGTEPVDTGPWLQLIDGEWFINDLSGPRNGVVSESAGSFFVDDTQSSGGLALVTSGGDWFIET